MTENEWIVGSDTGISSKTIWAVMMAVITAKTKSGGRYDVPHDPDDFGRCHRLLVLFPAWRRRLGEVAKLLPMWEPMVREWDEMTRLYLRDLPSRRCGELYNLMKQLVDEGRLLESSLTNL